MQALYHFFLLCSFFLSGYAEVNTEQNKPLKVSIIVPCHAKHVKHLQCLLQEYTQQTVLPNEVAISISEAYLAEPETIECVKQSTWPFSVQIFESDEILYAGQNRNIACSHAIGDILICQDADDLPHPQRVEIIRYFFEHYAVDHIMHSYFIPKPNQEVVFMRYDQMDKISFSYPKNYEAAYPGKTNGNIALSKTLFNKMQWADKPQGQDVDYNRDVYTHFIDRTLVINEALLAYRNFFSSW